MPRLPRPSLKTLSDADLVTRVRKGDERAFETLVRRHIPAAHGLATMTLGTENRDADDVVQEAFVKALERIDECRDIDRFRGWLLTIVRNTAHNRREYLGLRRGEDVDEVPGLSGVASPATDLERTEFWESLDDAMTHLTEVQQDVFRLHDIEGLRHHDVAARVGISEGNSRYHLHAARKMLRRHLTSHLPT